jgi:hypothetical protein
MQTSNPRKPVLALLTPERWAKRIGDFDRPDPFGAVKDVPDRATVEHAALIKDGEQIAKGGKEGRPKPPTLRSSLA